MKLVWTVILLALNAHAQFAEGNWRTDTAKKSIDLRELLRGGPPKDGIPSIDKPRFIPSKDANWIAPKELVIALQLGDNARAYPLQVLMWHELVNNKVGETPVLVSYCPLCNSAIVFDRRVEGKTLEFGVSGMLRNSDMVMYDRQTDSLWQQITGEGIVGAYTGSSLKMISSQMIPFDQFSESYPGGVVLSRETGFPRDYGRNPYRAYEFGNGPIMPVRSKLTTTLRPMEKLVVLKDGGGYRGYPVSLLARQGVIEDQVNSRRVVLFCSSDGLSPVDASAMAQSRSIGSVGVFYAEINSAPARFQHSARGVEDLETRSAWSITGRALDGKLKGTALKSVEHGVYFAFAWLAFQPETRIAGAPAAPSQRRR